MQILAAWKTKIRIRKSLLSALIASDVVIRSGCRGLSGTPGGTMPLDATST